MILKVIVLLSLISGVILDVNPKHHHHNHTHTKKPHHQQKPREETDDTKCKEHEIFTNCTCQYQLHCGNRQYVDCYRRCDSSNTSRPGCECFDGYVRDFKTKICIPVEKCPESVCEKDEVYKPCGACETPCQKLDDPVACMLVCDYNGGCECNRDEGFIRDSDTGRCIPLEKCPKYHPCND